MSAVITFWAVMSYYGKWKRFAMSRLSLPQAVKYYHDALHASDMAPNTQKQYRNVTHRLCAFYPDRQFAGITGIDLTNFLFGPRGISVGKADSTLTSHRAALRHLFRYGHSVGWRKDLLAVPDAVMRSGKAHQKPLPTRLTADQLILLLHRAEHPIMRGMMAVAMNTALRASDVRKILIGDLDLITGGLSVVIQKTGRSDKLPVTADLDEEMRRYLTWYTAAAGVTVRDTDAYLFPGLDATPELWGKDRLIVPTRPIGYDWSRMRLHELFEDCGIHVERGEAWHTIRRSVARIYFDSLRNEISRDHALRQTSALLGHRQAAQTEIYLGMTAEVEARDKSLRGKRLLIPSGNVTALRVRGA